MGFFALLNYFARMFSCSILLYFLLRENEFWSCGELFWIIGGCLVGLISLDDGSLLRTAAEFAPARPRRPLEAPNFFEDYPNYFTSPKDVDATTLFFPDFYNGSSSKIGIYYWLVVPYPMVAPFDRFPSTGDYLSL